MFFSPVLHALLSPGGGREMETATELWAACMTAGPGPTDAGTASASPSSPLLNNSLSNAALPLRARELLKAYAHFPGMGSPRAAAGAVQERVLIFSDGQLQDGMAEQWDPQRVRDVLLAGMEERFSALRGRGGHNGQGEAEEGQWAFDWLLTFDEQGISGHANHRALREAAPLVADALAARARAGAGGRDERRPQIWVLPTLPLPLKYGSLPFAIAQRAAALLFLPSAIPPGSHSSQSESSSNSASKSVGACLTLLSSPREYLVSLAAMRDGHASQMLWFRYAWWGMSSYVFGGRICRVE